MASWEYPPLVVGGIAAHVHGLATALVRDGHEVVVMSLHHPDAPEDTVVDGVRVLRARTDLPWIPSEDLAAQMASANHHLVKLATRLGSWRPEVVHAHDWLVAWAGDVLANLFEVPLVATVHATERGRHGGHVPAGTPAVVNSVEWWLTYQAREIICCSAFMTREVISGFELPPEKVHLVPNGVDPELWAPDRTRPREPMVLAWGRVQYEKGFQVLATAIGRLRQRVPDIRCVIAGRGSYLPDLQIQLDVEGLGDLVHLAGFVDDDELRHLLATAGCVAIPSLYEPFGIVALEAMAAGAPTVAARTGGLAEILEGTGAGRLFTPGDPDELADQIEAVLTDPAISAAMQQQGERLVQEEYSWDAIAKRTLTVYSTAAGS